MAWSTDAANSSTPVNDAALDGAAATWDDTDIARSEEEGTWDTPRSPWKRDAANSSVLTNDTAN